MAGVLSLLVALTLSLMVTRVAALALMFTGLSRESAKFQARSAFTGVGYTTVEAETTVNHPVRRQIIMLLMLLGNIGVATVIATIMVSVGGAVGSSWQHKLLIGASLCGGLMALWIFFSSRWVERHMNRLIAWALKTFTDLDVRDYVALLEISGGYAVSEMIVEPQDWLANKPLMELRLSDEGILVLGIRSPEGIFHGTPRGDDSIEAGDTLILYGNIEDIERLDRRRAGNRGDREHRDAVEEREVQEFDDAQWREEKAMNDD